MEVRIVLGFPVLVDGELLVDESDLTEYLLVDENDLDLYLLVEASV